MLCYYAIRSENITYLTLRSWRYCTKNFWFCLTKQRGLFFLILLSSLFYDDINIIDHTLLYSNHVHNLFYFFSCIAQVFTKYRYSKCKLFLPRTKYIDHDLIANGNYLAQLKSKCFHLMVYFFSLLLGCITIITLLAGEIVMSFVLV